MKRQSEVPWPWGVAWLLIAAGALALGACTRHGGSGSSGSPASYVVRVGYVTTGSSGPTGPEGWGFASGLLTRELATAGVSEVRFLRFPNGPDLNEAISAQAIDVGIVGDTPALVGKASGLPTRLINQSVLGMDVWLVGCKDGPRTVRDLDSGKVLCRDVAGLST